MVEEQIHKTFGELIDDLERMFKLKKRTEEQVELMMVKNFFLGLTPPDVALRAKEHILKYEEHIKSKNYIFFKESKELIFGGILTEDRINVYVYFIEKELSKKNRNTIWNYLSIILSLTKIYKDKLI